MVNFLFAVFSEHRLGQGVASVCLSAAVGSPCSCIRAGPRAGAACTWHERAVIRDDRVLRAWGDPVQGSPSGPRAALPQGDPRARLLRQHLLDAGAAAWLHASPCPQPLTPTPPGRVRP